MPPGGTRDEAPSASLVLSIPHGSSSPWRMEHESYFADMEAESLSRQVAHLTHSWSVVAEPTWDPKAPFLKPWRAEGP